MKKIKRDKEESEEEQEQEELEPMTVMELPKQDIRVYVGEDGTKYELKTLVERIDDIYKLVKQNNKILNS